MMSAMYSLALTAVLFGIGMYCLSGKRDMIRLLLGLGIMGNAANINMIALSTPSSPVSLVLAETTVIILVILEACVIAVGLTIVVYAYRHFKSIDADNLRTLRG